MPLSWAGDGLCRPVAAAVPYNSYTFTTTASQQKLDCVTLN